MELKKVNVMMYHKLDRIHKSPSSKILEKLKPIFEFKTKGRSGGLTREQKLQITTTNKYFRKKLNKQTSFYSLGQWNKDFEQTRNFKKNICEYPSIDFHKTKRIFGDGNDIKKEASIYPINIKKNCNFKKGSFNNIKITIKKLKGNDVQSKENTKSE